MEAKQTPLIELLERIPQDARLVVEHDQFSSSVHNVGRLAHEAAAALRAATPQRAEPAQNYWFEDANGAVRRRPEDCVAWGANGRPAAVWVNRVRYTPPAKKEETPCP